MSLIMTQRCLSAEPWFVVEVLSQLKEGVVYKVLVPYPDDPIDELTCECPGFVFRGACRHQDEVFETLCRWTSVEGPEAQTVDQRRKHICPRCGGETKSEAEWVL